MSCLELQDSYSERSRLGFGLLQRNARPDAVQRLLLRTRQLHTERPLQRSWKAIRHVSQHVSSSTFIIRSYNLTRTIKDIIEIYKYSVFVRCLILRKKLRFYMKISWNVGARPPQRTRPAVRPAVHPPPAARRRPRPVARPSRGCDVAALGSRRPGQEST